jgi:uncharacterized protein with von Willebrand factor type A (vWA) domain
MALTKEVVIDQITVLEDGQMQVREVTRIMEDGVELSKSYHRHVVAPGDDLTKEDAKVAEVGTVVHTEQVKDDFKAKQEAKNEQFEDLAEPRIDVESMRKQRNCRRRRKTLKLSYKIDKVAQQEAVEETSEEAVEETSEEAVEETSEEVAVEEIVEEIEEEIAEEPAEDNETGLTDL